MAANNHELVLLGIDRIRARIHDQVKTLLRNKHALAQGDEGPGPLGKGEGPGPLGGLGAARLVNSALRDSLF